MRKETFSGIRWILCKSIWCLLALMLMTGAVLAEGSIPAGADTDAAIEISFDYQRASTMASNQLAVWVEDPEHKVVKTLLVTSFTAGRRGYRNRDMSLPAWVEAADPESLTDKDMDAISSATPKQGRLTYLWDFTDEAGKKVAEGIYTIRVEGTLYWDSDVLYTATIDTASIQDEYPVEMVRTAPDTHENENMINVVSIRSTH